MKNTAGSHQYLIRSFCIMFIVAVLSGCSAKSEKTIVGLWQKTSGQSGGTIVFKEDGTFIAVDTSALKGNYKFLGDNKVQFSEPNGAVLFTANVSFSDEIDILTFSTPDPKYPLTYKRINKVLTAKGDQEQASPYHKDMTLDAAVKAVQQEEQLKTQQAVFNPSFDCAKASTDAERLICSNQELAALDVEMMSAYKRLADGNSDKNALRKEQNDWMKNQRNTCSTSDCMAKAYRSRIEDMESVAQYLSKPAEFR